jgi:type III secretion system FlhB-like substrate exporter
MAKANKSPYEVYKTHNSIAVSDALYSQILEKAQKFDVSMFQNPDLAKDLCNTTLVPSKIDSKASQAVIDTVVWLLESRNNAQLSQ